MNTALKSLALGLPLSLALCTGAQAVIVDIDAAVTGCVAASRCDGAPHYQPGDYVGDLINPVQLTLGPGTYTITNASNREGADPYFSAWRFNGSDNWVWAFEIIDDASKIMLVQGCCGDRVYDTQAGAANQSFARNYSSSFTLTATTTLDFITEDYYPYDNLGGVSLNIAQTVGAVPEPGTNALMLAGLCGVAAVLRSRRTPA